MSPVNSFAITLGPTVEAITISAVGPNYTSVSFENTYSNPVVTCSYTLPSVLSPPAAVRLNAVGGSSMQVRVRGFPNSAFVTPSTVSCLVAEEGVNILPDGRRLEARKVISNATSGQFTPDAWNIAPMENMSSSFSGFTSPMVLGQVMTSNDPNTSVFHANDCDNRGNPPFLSGFSDGICVSKHIGQINNTLANETLGVIVIERGTGSFNGVAYTAQRGADTVLGTGNAPPYNYSLPRSYEFGVVTQAGEDGGNGSWAVSYGAAPVVGSTLGVAVDEETAVSDTTRRHTTEQIDYFVVQRVPVFTASKTVDKPSITSPETLSYTITLENTGQLDQTGVLVQDTLPNGLPGALLNLTESGTTNGIFEAGETWTLTASYPVTAADITAGNDLVNNVSVTSSQYVIEGLPDVTASATTTIVPGVPSLNVTKTADPKTNVPAGTIVTYTYVVTNTGNQTLTNVKLTESHNASGPVPVPKNENLTADNNTASDSTDLVPNDGIWSTLAPGDEVTFTADYTVTLNDVITLQ